ncbi:MAG: HEPN domain-containing protein [Roseiarcus sp.]
MNAGTARFLAKARRLLREADVIGSVGLNEAAGRSAYLAGFHAAQALIFERDGRILKTHNGVRGEFLRLTRHEPLIDPELRAFLSSAYNLKAIADYETGPGSEVSPERAAEAIATARAFVDAIEKMIGA